MAEKTDIQNEKTKTPNFDNMFKDLVEIVATCIALDMIMSSIKPNNKK